MADTGKPDDGTDDGPSLEMPSFSLRRKKKAPATEDEAPDTTPDEVVEPEPQPEPVPEPEPEPEPVHTPEPEPEPEPVHVPEPVQERTAVIPEQPAYEPPTGVVPVVHEPEVADDEVEETEPSHREPRPRRELPLSGLPAAAATGLVVGALAVLLAWLAGVGCEAIRGTSACGGGPGFLILLLVLVALSLAGSWLLARFGVPEAGSTSLLAVGIMSVLVLVFLLGSLDTWWAAIAIPVAAIVGFAVSWWVTNAVVGEDTQADVAEPHDVR